MSTREQRVEVFQDTMDWISTNTDLTNSIQSAKKRTKVYYEDEYPDVQRKHSGKTRITVTGNRSFEAATKLHKENPQDTIAVVNFANAFHPGGGVTKGSSAQEESLCRCSTLYPLLYRRILRDTFYNYHKKLNKSVATDSLIYTEGVVICKSDEDIPQRLPKEEWVQVDVISVAAPDLRSKSNMHAPLVGNGTYLSDAALFGYHVKRAIHILTVAASHADVLVLGAFGCGAFENNPEIVARAYKVALMEFKDVFKKIEFAIYCTPSHNENYKVFKRVLEPLL